MSARNTPWPVEVSAVQSRTVPTDSAGYPASSCGAVHPSPPETAVHSPGTSASRVPEASATTARSGSRSVARSRATRNAPVAATAPRTSEAAAYGQVLR